MARKRKSKASRLEKSQNEPIERQLWKSANKLRKNIENASLRGVLPKVYARGNLDPTNLGGLIFVMQIAKQPRWD